MSQYVSLVRHAKSSWKTEGQSDFDRPLNDRGYRDSRDMASRLVARKCVPDLMLVSTAKRAEETASFLKQAFDLAPEQFQLRDDLYLAEPEILLDAITGVPDSISHLMIVAHNPGLEELSDLLAGHALPPLPTLGIRHFACPSLRALSPATASDTHFKHSARKTDTHKTLDTRGVKLLFEDFPKRTA